MQLCVCQAYRWQWGIIVILQHIPNAIWELITRYAKTFLLFRSKSWHISMAGIMKLLSMQKHFSFSVTKLQYPKIIMHNNLYLWGSVCEKVINPLLHGHWWGHKTLYHSTCNTAAPSGWCTLVRMFETAEGRTWFVVDGAGLFVHLHNI